MLNNFEMSELSMKEELKADFVPPLIKDLVREAMSEVIMEDSTVNGHVLNEFRQLKDRLSSLDRKVESLAQQLADNQPDLGLQNRIEDRLVTAESDLEELKLKVLQNEQKTVEQHANFMTLNDRLDTTQNKLNLCRCKKGSLRPGHPLSTKPTPTPAFPDEEMKRRLLIFPFNAAPHQISLDSNTVQPYPFIDVKKTLSVAFVSQTNKLLVSSRDPGLIQAFDLDSSSETFIRRGVVAYGMAVDGQRRLVFMSTYKPSKSLYRMNVDGSDLEMIAELRGAFPYSVAIDPVRQMVYVSMSTNIVSVRYDGIGMVNMLTNVMMGASIQALAMDVRNNVLYFNEGRRLKKLRLNKAAKGAKDVLPLEFRARNFQFYNGSLYISSSIGGEVEVIHSVGSVRKPNDHSTHRRLKIIADADSFMSICLVP
ncbi:uncharacterized protein [Haliotis asinina]|uniref:uncharacterized protein n=1 Tax=Haliotis asinina TaxID=109174 RepID=UPI0035327346